MFKLKRGKMVFKKAFKKLKKRFMVLKKGDFMSDNLGWWIIAIVIAALVLMGFFMVLRPHGEGAIDYIKNMFSFGGG